MFFFVFLFSLVLHQTKQSEVVGIGVLKGVKVAFRGMECVILKDKAIKILKFHYSFNNKKTPEIEAKFKSYVSKIEGKITVFFNF